MIDPIVSQERPFSRRRRQPEPKHGWMPRLGHGSKGNVKQQGETGDEKGAAESRHDHAMLPQALMSSVTRSN